MQVILNNHVHRKIMHFVNKSNYEVSGLGTVLVEDGGILRVTEIMLLPQKNGMTHTDIEPEDVGKLMFQLKDAPGDLRFWWHSHVDMDVFWSGTDMDTIRKIGAGGWFLSTVFNKRNEMRSAFYGVDGRKTPWGISPLFEDKLETIIAPALNAEAAEWDAEYEKNVTVRATMFAPYGNGARHYPGWDDDSGFPQGGSVHQFQTSTTGTKTGDTPTFKRPPGMSKREWKRLRKSRKETAQHVATTSAIINPHDVADVYGFTQEERTFLAQMGWTEHIIDQLFEEDVTPLQMLRMAESDVDADEVIDMLAEGFTPEDIFGQVRLNDGGPVMDQANGGKYDA